VPGLNEALQSAGISHQIGLQRLSTQTVAKIVALLNRTDADLVAQIQRGISEQRDVDRGTQSPRTTPRSFWTRQAPESPTLEQAIAVGGISPTTTWPEWESLSPGMRREIVRRAIQRGGQRVVATGASPATVDRLNKLLSDIRVLNRDVYRELHKALRDNLIDIASYETWFQQRMLATGLTVRPEIFWLQGRDDHQLVKVQRLLCSR
jgi:hypothetical protein